MNKCENEQISAAEIASSGRRRSRHTDAARHFAQKFHYEIFVHFAQILLQVCNIPKVTKL